MQLAGDSGSATSLSRTAQILQENYGQKEAKRGDLREGALRGAESAGCIPAVRGRRLHSPYVSHRAIPFAPVSSHLPEASTQDLQAEVT